MERAKNAIIVGLVVVIVILLVGMVYLFVQNNSGNIQSSDNNNDNQQQNNEENENNSNKKIDDTKDIVYENVVSKLVDESGQEFVVSLPIINIDTEEIRALNKHIVDKHGNNYYTEFEYYKYNDILSVYIYLGLPTGDGGFVTYNIDIENNKVIKDNNQLLTNLNIDIDKYLAKQNEAITSYFDNYWKDSKFMFNTTAEYNEQYNIAKKYTQSEENNNINNYIYIDNSGDIYVVGTIDEYAGKGIYERVVKVCNITDSLTSESVVKQSDQFYLDLVNKLPMQINMIQLKFC